MFPKCTCTQGVRVFTSHVHSVTTRIPGPHLLRTRKTQSRTQNANLFHSLHHVRQSKSPLFRMSSCVVSDTGGLSHLVEAATALVKLNGGPQSSLKTPKSREKPGIISWNGVKSSPPPVVPCQPTRNKREIFPQRLMTILNDTTLTDIVTWLPHGRSFVIVRPDEFTEKVLPQYLAAADVRASTKYPSFTRKLNRWYVYRKDQRAISKG